ncbi:methyl farnesoate epoxidase-like [Pollicipes pollicipes]|uniref:methyl farnesoate epoxidase-like n=1 Tax=Pollicipes pollicipes TaxID=41117 RepID=UPI001884ED82|nr:methyl farnesoate epoxidase-like [Pollicipes pollicipes]
MDLGYWALLLVVVGWLYLRTRKAKKFPPGPARLPIVGTLWRSHVGREPQFIRHCRMAREYGKVVGYYFFDQPAVMIFDVDLARGVFATNDSAGRPHMDVLKKRTFGEMRGILFNEGPSWQRQRRFALQHLRDLGMGRASLETIVQQEVGAMIRSFTERTGKPVAVQHLFNVFMLNVPWEIISGKRFDERDPRLPVILRAISDVSTQGVGLLGIVRFLFGSYLTSSLSQKMYRGMEENRDGLVAILKEEIQEHKESMDPKSPKDFIDAYLIEMSSTSDSSEFTELTLYSVLMDLFTASTGTNSVSLEWAMLFLVLYPECQRRARAELAAVVGPGRLVTLEDQPHLPYTQALVAETLRRSSVLALGVLHRATADIPVAGYIVPKDAWLYINLYAIHHDVEYWGDPFNFRPERFIHDGQFQPDTHLVPFSVGKRICMGESLGRTEQFLFLANIVHHFEVLTPEGDPAPRFDYQCGARNSPAPFRVTFRPTG